MNDTDASSLDPQPAPRPIQIRLPLPVSVPRVTYVILGATVFVYVLQLASVASLGYTPYGMDWLELFGARINDLIQQGQVWRFITPVFLHGSIPHIFFNMYALFSIGSMLERHYGHQRFILLYFLAAFSGNVTSFLLASDSGYSVGASTAIFGLAAAEGIFFYQNRKLFGADAQRAMANIVFVVAINLFIGLAPGIDNWGHVGGLLGGAIFAWFAGPRWMVDGVYPALYLKDQHETRDIITGTALSLIFFGGAALAGLLGII